MPAAFAQDDDADAVVDEAEAAAQQVIDEAESAVEEVVVTGSRLRRDTYSSISPLQVITTDVTREIGTIDPGTILHESSATSGVQFDLTFGNVIVDGGPASSNVDLRGLGASRTLFLLNGRRLAPSGVEGAPSSPDVGLIPGSLVQQYDVLLDGASSIYGSDAIAGVVNVILDKDFDGLELEVFSNIPAAGNSEGMRNTITGKWGYSGDRGFIGIGAEYSEIERLRKSDRDWFGDCQRHAEITTDGELRTEGLWWEYNYGFPNQGECVLTNRTGSLFAFGGGLSIGEMLYREGFSNTGIPNFSVFNQFGVIADTTGDGWADVSWLDRNLNGNDQFVELVPQLETSSVMALGEYTFDTEANITPYFELMFNRRESAQTSFVAQLFPTLPAQNPFNPCNPLGAGVDCGLAQDSLYTDPNFLDDWLQVYPFTPAQFGLLTGPVGPVPVQTIVHVRGDRNNVATDVKQTRIVAGVRGDMPFMNFGSFENWSFDFYALQTDTSGDSLWNGVRGDLLDYALGNYSSTGTPCENDLGFSYGWYGHTDEFLTPGCVPVNMFAPSLIGPITQGEFATQAERDYVFGTREFTTDYIQTVYSLYMNGDIFELPGGDAMFGIGFEYRNDEIKSIPNDVAGEGLFAHFIADKGAVGEKFTRQFFAETELPLFAGYKGMKELTVNVSANYTEDQYYEGSWTYSAKMRYRPIDSLTIRGTAGTSYRAPNLRENFLDASEGFVGISDPCVIPTAAVDVNGNYIPANDNRDPVVIQNCINDPNVDPFSFTNGGIQVYGVRRVQGGALDLDEERSDTFSAGFVWEQPFWESFDMIFGATYYDIEIRGEIIDPSAGDIIGQCYGDPEFDSPWCSRITRVPGGAISRVDAGFINRDILAARGLDLNLRIDWPTQMFGRAVDFAADFAFNRAYERSSSVEGEDKDEFTGEFGFPEWQGRGTFRADIGNWAVTWSTRYLSSVEQDEDGIDPFGNVFNSGSDTCLGEALGDVDCRDIGYARNYFTHDASVFYRGDTWTIGVGMRNITDAAPPYVDWTEISSWNNRPRGRGYDLWGRTAFVNVVYNWQ